MKISEKGAVSTEAESNDLDSFVSVFEEQAISHQRPLSDEFLPPPSHPHCLEISTELVRIDLELARERGKPRELEEYRELVPAVFTSPTHLTQIAFEEYRLRCADGEQLSAESYFENYRLDQSSWPEQREPEPSDAKQTEFPSIGTSFDGLPLESNLGAGAFSQVYLARQPDFGNRLVALKVSPQKSLEHHHLGRLQHTNIVPIYSLHHDRELRGICMPFFGAMTLADAIKRSASAVATDEEMFVSTVTDKDYGTLTDRPTGSSSITTSNPTRSKSTAQQEINWREAAECIAQLADGLAHAHKRGIVHSDVKPANILLGDDGVPRLLDFHLATNTDSLEKDSLIVGGTLPYMAPEHIEAVLFGRPVRPESDTYSLGAILFQMLARQLPFPSRRGMIEEIAADLIADRHTPPAYRELDASVPPGVQAILVKCLAPNPEDRYSSAAQLATDLRSELNNQPLMHAREPSLLHASQKWSRRNRKHLTRAAIAACIAGVVAMASLLGSANQTNHRLAAREALTQFQALALEARMGLCVPDNDAELLQSGMAKAQSALQVLGATNDSELTSSEHFAYFPADEQHAVSQTFAELQGLLANAANRFHREPAQAITTLPLASSASVTLESSSLLWEANYSLAEQLLRAAVAKQSHDPVLWLQLGVSEMAQGNTSSAMESFTAATAIQPDSAIAWRYRAFARIDTGQYELGLGDLEKALNLTAGSPSLHLNRAIAYYNLQRFEEAELSATKALNLGADQPRAWLLRARIRDELADTAGATSDRETAKTKTPLDAEDWTALALACQRDAPKEALEFLDQGLADFPNSTLILRNKIHLLGDVLKDPELARHSVDRLLEILPTDQRALLSKAVLLARKGETDLALETCHQLAVEKLRPIDQLQLACAYALCSIDQETALNRSLACLRKALSKEPQLVNLAARDQDLMSLRDHDAFQRSLAAAAFMARPIDIASPKQELPQ